MKPMIKRGPTVFEPCEPSSSTRFTPFTLFIRCIHRFHTATTPQFRFAVTFLTLLILLLSLTGCATGPQGTSTFMCSTMEMSYNDSVTSATARVVAPVGSNNIENFKWGFEQGAINTDGHQKITFGGGRNVDTGNQFKMVDSFFGFLAGVFAGKVVP